MSVGGFSGGCLYGAVRYECVAAPIAGGNCHCLDCRKTRGTAHASHVVAPRATFQVTGETTAFDKPADSGNVVT
ncbi:MAG: GFA family protein [Rhodospirillaceae bacterium]